MGPASGRAGPPGSGSEGGVPELEGTEARPTVPRDITWCRQRRWPRWLAAPAGVRTKPSRPDPGGERTQRAVPLLPAPGAGTMRSPL